MKSDLDPKIQLFLGSEEKILVQRFDQTRLIQDWEKSQIHDINPSLSNLIQNLPKNIPITTLEGNVQFLHVSEKNISKFLGEPKIFVSRQYGCNNVGKL